MNDSFENLPIGFLSVVSVEGLGHCGGYLLTNRLGRPVEFHCTAPVTENRTQRILYGKTYDRFLFCDQIGRALVARARQQVIAVVTDLPALAEMRESLESPLLLLRRDDSSPAELPPLQASAVSEPVSFGGFQLDFISGRQDENREAAIAACRQLNDVSIPLDEPFERIRQAIDEAQAAIR